MSGQSQNQMKMTQRSYVVSEQAGLLQRKSYYGQHTVVGGEREECRAKRKGTLQRAAVNTVSTPSVPSIVHDVLNSSGQPLDVGARAFMEPRFGHDFSGVRVHTNARAAESARSVNALAYTVGRNVVFGTGQYAPGTGEGRRLLAHELTHVVQQDEEIGSHMSNLQVGGVDTSLEREASFVANSVGKNYALTMAPSIKHESSQKLIQRVPSETQYVTTSDFGLSQEKNKHDKLVEDWHERYLRNLDKNLANAKNASIRFIDFSEGGINQLRSAGSVSSGIAYLFGSPGSVVALCIIVFTEVAAQKITNKSAKTASAVARLDQKSKDATMEIDARYTSMKTQITDFFDGRSPNLLGYYNMLANLGVPQVVPENIIFRDLLLQLAEQGEYNVSGSQWNVDNMTVFGKAPWYHSWDWGSPGWINGQDIADELNNLAEGDPSTRKDVAIHPPH